MSREINRIFLHCTDSEWGNVESIRRFHVQERGWDDIGYHYVITNAFTTFEQFHNGQPDPDSDGKAWIGRPEDTIGAHVAGANRDSIGVALVGVKTFSGAQIVEATKLITDLCHRHEVGFSQVHGHYENNPHKTCPNLDMDYFRSVLWDRGT